MTTGAPVSVPVGKNPAYGEEEDVYEDEFAELRERQRSINYSEVWMSAIEIDVVLHYMGSFRTCLEWGGGGSTKNFAPLAGESHTIEHDREWCDSLKEQVDDMNMTSHVHIHCIPVPRGHRGWGKDNPFEEGTYEQFKEYVDHVNALNVSHFDFVLVDGRARIPAAVRALSYISRNSVVVLHDAERAFRSKRGYQRIWDYYDAVDSIGGTRRQGLPILRRKKKFANLQGDHDEVQRILDSKFL